MGVQLFRLLNDGNYESIGEFNTITDIKDNTDIALKNIEIQTAFPSNKVYKGSLFTTARTQKRFEQLFIFGWKNDMPFRRRTLIKALIKRDWREFTHEH